MTSLSIAGLRKHSNVPVKVIFLDTDNDCSDEFQSFCDRYDVEIIRKKWIECDVGERNLFQINKAHLVDVEEDEMLFIDSDTFIFGDVESIFDKYGSFDMVACKNLWVKEGWEPRYLKKIHPINSGVMYWKRKWAKLASEALPILCKEIRERKHPISEYLYFLDERCFHREEFAYNLFIDQQDIQHSYFEKEDVHNLLWESEIEDSRNSIILHSYTSQWKKVYNALYGPSRKSISKKLITHRRKARRD